MTAFFSALRWPRWGSLHSLRGRMALIVGLATLPAGAVALQASINTISARDAARVSEQVQQAQMTAQEARALSISMRDTLRVLAVAPSLQGTSVAACRERLHSIRDEYRQFAVISVISTDARIHCSDPVSANADVSGAPIFERARRTQALAMGLNSASRITRQPVLAAVAPQRDARDRIIGYVGIGTNAAFAERSMSAIQDLTDGRAVLIDSVGQMAPAQDGVPPPPALNTLTPEQRSGQREFRADDHFGLLTPLNGGDAFVYTTWRAAPRAGWEWVSFVFAVALPLLTWLLAVGLAWLAVEIFIARPLSQLERVSRNLARGEDAEDRTDLLDPPEEIRSLRRTITAMAKTLRAREARIAEALQEEKALMREVHHRVKNNLQMVASLLNIQARTASEAEALGLARAHDRIQLLATVHQKLYGGGGMHEVHLDELCGEIARQLTASRADKLATVKLDLALNPTLCDTDMAVPMAFLIGECLSSVLDLVAARSEAIDVKLSMSQDEDKTIHFQLEGPSLAPRVVPAGGVANRLIDAFARQIGATVERNAEQPQNISIIAVLRVAAK